MCGKECVASSPQVSIYTATVVRKSVKLRLFGKWGVSHIEDVYFKVLIAKPEFESLHRVMFVIVGIWMIIGKFIWCCSYSYVSENQC